VIPIATLAAGSHRLDEDPNRTRATGKKEVADTGRAEVRREAASA